MACQSSTNGLWAKGNEHLLSRTACSAVAFYSSGSSFTGKNLLLQPRPQKLMMMVPLLLEVLLLQPRPEKLMMMMTLMLLQPLNSRVHHLSCIHRSPHSHCRRNAALLTKYQHLHGKFLTANGSYY